MSTSQINPDAPLAQAGAIRRAAVLSFGVFAYVIFLAIFLYLIGFLGNAVVPKTINTGTVGSTIGAVLVNLGILAIFAAQHTIMARPAFKRWWTQIVPEAARPLAARLASSRSRCSGGIHTAWEDRSSRIPTAPISAISSRRSSMAANPARRAV